MFTVRAPRKAPAQQAAIDEIAVFCLGQFIRPVILRAFGQG
jgi:hypothetical protein